MELPDPNSHMGEAYALTWGRCPYPAELCGTDAIYEPIEVDSDDGVVGQLICLNGHRWRTIRLADVDEWDVATP